MKKITYITDPAVLGVPIVECHEPLIDVRDYHDLQYGGPPECELTRECYTLLRETVFKKLCRAQQDLPNGWRFRLYEGFRSLKVQRMLFEQMFENTKARNPGKSYVEIFKENTRLVSPVTNLDGSKNTPAHNTGGAVDVEIIDAQGQLVDMGMAAKDWCVVDPDLCLTDSILADEEAQRNRRILLEVMQAQGFVNYPTEWWHFSYGDRYWAYHQPVKMAVFGSADAYIPSHRKVAKVA